MVSSCAPWWVPRSDFIGGRAAVRWSPTSVTWSCKDVPHRTAHTPDPSRGGEDKYRYRDELGRRVVDIRRPASGRNEEKATARQHNDGDRVGDPTEHLPEAARHRGSRADGIPPVSRGRQLRRPPRQRLAARQLTGRLS